MDQLFAEQQGYAKEIENVISNYKKDPADRKTKATYYEERLRRLDAAWSLFHTVDKEIRNIPDPPQGHAYFINNYYKEVKRTYEQYKEHFAERLLALQGAGVHQDEPSVSTNPAQNPISQAISENPTELPKPTQRSVESQFQDPEGLKKTETKSKKLKSIAHTPMSKGAIPKTVTSTDQQPIDAEVIKAIRRQGAMAESLRRILITTEDLRDSQQPKAFFKLKIESINHHWSKLEEQHHKIWELTEDPTTFGYDITEYINLEERVHQCLIILADKLEQCTTALPAPAPSPATTMLKLPKITLPKFDGDYSKWRQFYDLFSQMVHNQNMSNCQKMWYLKTNLTGEAEKLLRHFTLTEENYTAAWRMLRERYENPRLLAASLINKLLAQPSNTGETSSATAIKSMHDTTQECLLGLENLGIPTTSWDPLLLHILLKKVDKTTHYLYEQSLSNPKGLQSLNDFLTFLETRFQSLEALGNKGRNFDDNNKKQGATKSLTSIVSSSARCIACSENHQLFRCQNFLRMSPNSRINLLRKHGVCFNCLKPGHSSPKCTLRGCTKCSKKHNTLVHIEPIQKLETPVSKAANKATEQNSYSTSTITTTTSEHPLTLTTTTDKGYVLLSTARIKLIGDNGSEIECRALLDSGSQVNLITSRAVKKLGVTPIHDSMSIQGIGHGKQHSQRRISVKLASRTNGFSARLEAFVLTHIISDQPAQPLDVSTWKIPHNIQLADPAFDRPERIDVLLGAEFYHHFLSIGQIKLGKDLPTLQNTVFGWIVAGKVNQVTQPSATCGVCTEAEMDKAIERFWKIEEGEEVKGNNFTISEKQCEALFNQTVQRDDTGRFIVRLPFSRDPDILGQSKDIALRRFYAIERKLAKNQELRQQYVEFMQEYIQLGHMEEVNINGIPSPHYFLPHHCVLKPDSTTTKLRVVFDASAKTSSNLSLNDILHTGPTIQDDLFTILLRFRLPRFVFSADIQKMYRQVQLHEEDRKFHLIFWRSDPSLPLKCYQLRTVTYGTSSAPYLATKCLQRLSELESTRYPNGSEVLRYDFYVDDVITGANSLVIARDIQTQLITILNEAGFKLRKWCANHPRLLQDIAPEDQEVQLNFTDEKAFAIKTLGLGWKPKVDQFFISSNWEPATRITKRTVTSDISRIFDPLGIMAPVVVTAKMFLQELWMLKLDWDAALPMALHTRWATFRDKLKTLNDIQFPRHVFAHNIPKSVQLHAFADASERAYGASIYVRSIDSERKIIVRLLCAKSKVAPTKKVTLPRLELCAAKLAAELVNRVKRSLKLQDVPIYLWTDSEIVLSWINSTSTSYQTFVANRISTIQEITIPQQWRHVSSKDNPADVLSRGIEPERLKSCNLWFYGPAYLHGNECIWPSPYSKDTQCDLEKKRSALAATTSKTYQDELSPSHFIYNINHGNSFRKLQRVIAYVLRFIRRIRKCREDATTGKPFTAQDLDEALTLIVNKMQEKEFKEDIHHLKQYKEIKKTSPLASLSPFLDEKDTLRVGGRLEASSLSYDAKHPMLLPYAHEFTKLLMTDIHRENCHVGPQGLLSMARQRFWPIKGKTIARSVVQHCVHCAKSKPKLLTQIMGNLPPNRIQPTRPFVNSGVDFCGPIWIHYKIRGKRPQKAYIAVFCCFATKAVHLELVSDLSTDAFIGALKRFIGRRGHCRNLYCDNATNFVGAKNQLADLSQAIYTQQSKEKITSICSRKGLDFHFIPPRAPHFGGLWEAAVKSAKYLLQRTISSASLTYEELETVIIEIEAILNSRPLTPMSADPNDLTALTPGHFLIGEPLTTSVDAQAKPFKTSLLQHWKAVSHLKHEFWKRWSLEYLHELQHRLKWKQSSQNVKPGTIVVIKEDNVPVMKWPLGRIVAVHKGEDGHVRVADVRTSSGVYRRAIHNLAPLPCEEDFTNDSSSDQGDQNTQTALKRSNNEDTTTDKSLRKKPRSSFGSSLVTFLLACLVVLPAIKGTPIEITQFKPQLGMHFENLGTINLVTTEWKLIVYYDLQPYWTEISALKNGTIALQHLCDQITHKASCLQLNDHFNHLQEELNNGNELLAPQHLSTRQKRGAINIVGNVANSLFGILDSQYAEEMSKTITAIQENEQNLVGLLRNQTSVVDSTINIIKRDQITTERKFKALDNQITQIINRINGEGDQNQQNKIQHLFMSLAIQISLITSNLQRVQSAIVNILTDIHHGRINPLLLSPNQLKQEVAVIRNHLPISFRLPTNEDNMLELYKLMTVNAGIANNHIIFQVKLPLVSGDNYELFRVIAVPSFINDSFLAVKSYSPFLAITPHRDQYYPLNQQELSSCTILEGSRYLCKQLHPVYHRGANISACEIELFNNRPIISQCELIELKQQPIWIQLSHLNQWIFALKSETLVNVVCDGEAFPITLNGSGLLKIQPNCILKENHATIHGHQIYSSNARTSYTRLGLTHDTISPDQWPIKPDNNSQYQAELDALNRLQRELASLNLSTLSNKIERDTVHHFSISYLALGFIVIIAVHLGWKYRTKFKKQTTVRPQPQPRRHRSPNHVVQV